MRLRFEAKPDVQTMATDGTTLFYAPDFVATLPDAELVGVMAHQVMHCALLHPFRRGSRDLA
jgi:predicted metal-dependent peptidase